MANFPTQVPDQDVSAYEQWQLDQHVQDLDRERRDEQAQSQQDAAAQAQQTAAELRRFSPFDDVFRKYAGPLAGNDEFISILAAGTKAESGWNPNATGDNGHSIGIFQMHDQGAGAGLSRDQRADPDTASAHMVPRYVAAYQQAKAQNPNLGGPELASLVAAMAERPLGWDNPQSAARRGYASAYGDVMGGKAPPVAVPPAILNPNQTSSSDFLDYVQGLDQQRQAVQREAGANQFQDFVRELDQRRRQMLGDTSPRPGLGMDVGGDLFGGLASRMAPRQSGVMDPRDRGVVPPSVNPPAPAPDPFAGSRNLTQPGDEFSAFVADLDQRRADMLNGPAPDVAPSPSPPVMDARDAGVLPPPAPAPMPGPSPLDQLGGAVRAVGDTVGPVARGAYDLATSPDKPGVIQRPLDAAGWVGERARDLTPTSIISRSVAGEEQIAAESRPEYQQLMDAIGQFGPDSPQAQRAADAYNARTGALRAEGVYNVAERNPTLPAVEGISGLAAGGLAQAIAPGAGVGVARNLASAALDPLNPVMNAGVAGLERGAQAAGAVGREMLPGGSLARARGSVFVGTPGDAAASGARRYYHGTGTVFDAPDPERFEPHGLYGPGYYMTSDARVAGSGDLAKTGYAETRLAAEAPKLERLMRDRNEIAAELESFRSGRLREVFGPAEADKRIVELSNDLRRADEGMVGLFGQGGPNVRAIDVPDTVRLFDVEGPVPQEVVGAVDRILAADGASAQKIALFHREFKREPIGQTIYDTLHFHAGYASPEYPNKVLASLGYDGIRYSGGKRIPMTDAAGNAIEHEALVIFPESLDKIRNAFTGQPRGAFTPDLSGAALGAAGSQASDEDLSPEERIKRAVFGIGLGFAASRGARTVRPPRGSDVLGEMIGKGPSQWDRFRDWMPKSPQEAVDRAINTWFQQDHSLFDTQSAVADAYRLATGDELPASLRAADQIRNLSGSAQAARIRIQNDLGPAIAPLRELGPDGLGDFAKYLAANDALDKATMLEGKYGAPSAASRLFSGKTADEIRTGLGALEQEVGPQVWKQFQESADQVRAYVDGVRDRLVQSGILSPERAQYFKDEFPNYVPINIIAYEGQHGIGQARPGFGLTGSGIQHLTEEGTKRFMQNPLLALADMGYGAERRAAINDAANALYQWRDIDPDLGKLMRPVPTTYRPRADEAILRVWQNGEPVAMAVDKPLADMIGYMPELITNPVLKAIAATASVFRAATTARNPIFAIGKNPVMDMPAYGTRMAARHGLGKIPAIAEEYVRALDDAFQGLGRGQIEGKNTQRYLAGRGGMGGSYSGKNAEIGDLVANLGRERVIENKGDLLRLLREVATFDWVPAVGERLELTPRVAAMRMEERFGTAADPANRSLDAIRAGRNATLDFAQGGSLTKALNPYVPFFNVAFQPMPWLAQTYKDNPKGAIIAAAALIGMLTLATEAWNRSDPERKAAYDDVPDYIKRNNNVLILRPNAGVDENGRPKHDYVVIPMRYAGPLVAALHGAVRAAMGEARPDEWRELFNSVMQTTSPFQTDSGAGLAGSFISGPAGTAAQLALGKDLFRDREIVSERSNEEAAPLAKWVAERLGVAPGAVDFAARDAAGYYGNLILATSDLAKRIMNGESIFPHDTAPGELPVVGGVIGSFIGHKGGQQDRDLARLRDHAREALIGERQQQPDWATLSPADQKAAENRLSQIATLLTFGTSARPESVVQSVKDSKAFSGLSPEERTQTLAALRDSLGKQAVAARAEGNAPWLKALADRGIDVANPDISHVPPAQVGDYLRDSRTAVRRAVEWQLNEDPTFKRQTPDGQAQLLREAISQAHQTVARDYGIPGDPAKQLGQPPKYLFDGMPVPPEREAVAAQALEAYQRWKLAGEFGPPPAAGSRVEINPYWSDWSKSRGEVQAQRETVIERKVREAVGTKK